MDAKLVKTNTNGLTTSAERSGRRRGALLLCLLMLVGGFSCDRNNPQSEQKPAETPQPVAKLPLPQHGDQVARSTSPVVSVDNKASAPAVNAAPKSAPSRAIPPAKELPKPKVEPKKTEAPASGGQKPLPIKAVVKDQNIVSTPKAESRKPAVAGVAKDKKPASRPEKKVRTEAGKASTHGWTVVVGTYLLEDAMAPDLVKVRKVGLDAAVKPGARKKTNMNRLLLAEYSERSAAQSELDKLKQQTSDAFILTHGEKHAVYAGSYLLDSRAASEKERLAAVGFSLTLKRVNVAIPSKVLTAGNFDDRKAAEEAANKLKEAGLRATVVRQ